MIGETRKTEYWGIIDHLKTIVAKRDNIEIAKILFSLYGCINCREDLRMMGTMLVEDAMRREKAEK